MRAVVGESSTASGTEAFCWTQSEGMVGLGSVATESSSRAFGVSADGSVVVRVDRLFGTNRGFQWMQSGGMDLIPSMSYARGVPYDGSVVARDGDLAVSGDGSVIASARSS